MATLRQIGTSGFVGLAPTPVQARVINNYLVNDPLMNVMRFVNIGQGTNLGNFVASFVLSAGDVEATFRELGQEYDPNNQTLTTENVTLKILGGAFESDIEIARAFGTGNANVAANWTEEQIVQKLNAIKNAFAKYFVVGDSSKASNQFDGIEAKIKAEQIVADVIDVSALTDSKAFEAEKQINKAIAKMKVRPNVILTTADAKAVLTTLNAYRHRDTKTVTVNDLEYDQYMGIPVIALTDNCFKAEDLVGKYPLYMLYVDEQEGIRTAIPMDGQITLVLPPKFDNGKVVERGACEMACAPIFSDYKTIVKCYISDTPANDTLSEG